MEDIESWLQSLTERAQGALALGQPLSSWYEEASRFQQTSLLQQHESLAAIVTLLIKSDYTSVEDFHKLLDKLPRRERWNHLTVHYIPAIIAFSSQYGCPEGSTTLRESRALNTRILDLSGTASWILGTLQAVTVVFWLAEHNSWYIEVPSGSPVQGANLQDEARIRSQAFSKALADGAFQCILSICSSLRPSQWYNPTRAGLIDFLLRDAPFLGLETNATSSYFQELYMEQIEIFTNALVTNMPDTLRRFKSEEDDQRRLLLSGQQGNRDGKISEQDLHLERFMVIISLAYQDRSESATLFWDDPDGNLYGFVQWASKRLSTPQVASFCLMLSSIAEGKQCASSAHKFLQEESKTSLSRQHRSSSLTWFTIFEELQTYTNKVRDHSTDIRTGNLTISVTGLAEISEPESVLMLECYLRLAATITRESLEAAQWIMRYPAFHVVDNLLSLCSPGVPGRLQAYAFSLLQALSIGTDSESAMAFWACIDQWASGALGSPTATAGRNPITPDQASHIEVVAFSAIAADAELASEFTALLQSLILLRDETGALCDRLPFPEQLGSTYRMPGIDPYVDLVFGKLLLSTVPRTDDILQRRILQYHILNFGVTCLGSFNENLIILANQSPIDIDSTISTSSLQDYITLHPLGKVMDWMFNDAVLREIFATSRQDIDEVASAAPDSPLILLLLRCLDIMNLVMELQSTYLEILRPRLSAKSVDQRVPVFSTSLASFQDAVANNLGLIVDLAKYSGVGIQNLATSALTLLGKLASSRRLNNQFASLVSQSLRRNRLIEVLQQNDEMEPIQHYLTSAMEVTDRELEHGPDSSRYLVKISILDFLNNCLDGLSSTPSLAHALLGYTCHGSTIFVDEDSEFSRGVALFHAVVSVILSYPDGQDLDISGWTQILKRKAIQVLRTLWQSPMTSSITLTELQAYEVLPQLLFGQTLIDINTQWAGRGVEDEDFIFTESAIALTGYLYQRGALLDLASEELRLSKVDDAAISASKIISILVGLKPVAQESTRVHNLLLDLLDFISLDPFLEVPAPPSSFFASLNTEVFVGQSFAGSNEDRSTKLLEDLISLRLNQLHTGGQLASQMDLENAETEASLLFLNARGRTSLQAIEDLRLKVLQAWINALMLVITDSECEEADKFYLRERTVSKLDHQLERFAKDVKPEAVEIAKLMHFLLSEHIKATRGNGFASVGIGGMNEKLYVLYQTSVRSIYVPDGSAELRQVLYDICRTYLNSSVVINGGADLRKQIQRVIWLAGKSLLDHLCDDALGELGARRISALLTLKSFEDFSHTVDFDYVSKTLSEANFIVVLVESIQDLPLELKETASEGNFDSLCHSITA